MKFSFIHTQLHGVWDLQKSKIYILQTLLQISLFFHSIFKKLDYCDWTHKKALSSNFLELSSNISWYFQIRQIKRIWFSSGNHKKHISSFLSIRKFHFNFFWKVGQWTYWLTWPDFFCPNSNLNIRIEIEICTTESGSALHLNFKKIRGSNRY